jgi:hypothetical protein
LDTPYSVHRGLYGPAGHRSSTSWSKVGAISAKASETLDPAAIPAGGVCANENAPSRWRLRPASRLATAEATTTRRAINLGRSVLGASRTLGRLANPVKELARQLVANCDLFFSHKVKLRSVPCALARRGKKNGRARRPDRMSSPSRERFRPPSRRTFRFRVVLLGGLRPTGAPCSAQAAMYGIGPVRSRGYEAETSRYLRAH